MEDEVEVDYGPDEDDEVQEPRAGPDSAEDIYSDLYDAEGETGTLLKSKNAALQEQCRGQELLIQKLRERIDELTEANVALSDERRILVRNISCIYRTAKEEMNRMVDEKKKLRADHQKAQDMLRAQRRESGQQPALDTPTSSPSSPPTPPDEELPPPPPPAAPPPV